MISIKKAGIESIPAIQELAQITWDNTYTAIISEAQIKYMLDLFYSNDSLMQQMQNGHQFIIAGEEGMPMGFASFSQKEEGNTAVYRLHKVYISPYRQEKGVGKTLLNFIVDEIKEMGALNLELNVNRINKAIGFYKKLGFIITREEDIDIGNGYFMNDYVMNLSLDAYA